MIKSFGLCVALVLFGAGVALAQHATPQLERVEPTLVQSVEPQRSEECCKICRKGKACGDTCVSRDKDCHQPPGCACDG